MQQQITKHLKDLRLHSQPIYHPFTTTKNTVKSTTLASTLTSSSSSLQPFTYVQQQITKHLNDLRLHSQPTFLSNRLLRNTWPTLIQPTSTRPTLIRPTSIRPTLIQPTSTRPTLIQPTSIRPTSIQPTQWKEGSQAKAQKGTQILRLLLRLLMYYSVRWMNKQTVAVTKERTASVRIGQVQVTPTWPTVFNFVQAEDELVEAFIKYTTFFCIFVCLSINNLISSYILFMILLNFSDV